MQLQVDAMELNLPFLSMRSVHDWKHLVACRLVQHVFIPEAMLGTTKHVLGVLIEECLNTQ